MGSYALVSAIQGNKELIKARTFKWCSSPLEEDQSYMKEVGWLVGSFIKGLALVNSIAH